MKTEITLRLKEQPSIPVEAESINPENLKGKSLKEIYHLPLWSGNRRQKLEDYFEVEITESGGEAEEAKVLQSEDNLAKVVLAGDLSRFKRLGQGMAAGEMEIRGSVGFHAGASMRGGVLRIKGNAADWLGAHMEGGQIMVEGSAGHFVGAAYRGKTQGMSGGTILIRGSAGQMTGSRMRRGLIAVGGDCGDVPGFKMLAGTILISGACGIRAGANMRRGTIVLLQPTRLLPSFYYNCCYRPVFWGILVQELRQKGFELPHADQDFSFQRFSGDANEGGKGEILICQSN
ncbi:MAG: formylmethanofuran dehydrogenase subunit C [Peptococcaceae bacterium]|nr:formylmethanofuran dehydrogenase subunit C [Peptococcaceae bacterium]